MTASREIIEYTTMPADVIVVALDITNPQTLDMAYDLDVRATKDVPGLVPAPSPGALKKILGDEHPKSETFAAACPGLVELLGYVTVAPIEISSEGVPDWRITTLVNIGIDPDRDKARGIGSLLFGHCIDIAKGHGAHELEAYTSLDNERAVCFYIRKGMAIARHVGDTPFGSENGPRVLFTLNVL